MNHKSITPNPQQPVDRKPAGQRPSALDELNESALTGSNVLSQTQFTNRDRCPMYCSYDGDDE